MDKLIPFLTALSWTVIIINSVVWFLSIRHFLTLPATRQRFAHFKFNWMDPLSVLAIIWLIFT